MADPRQDSALAFSNTELLGIRSVAGEPRLFNLLVNSLSPAIFGHEIVKAPPPYACCNTDYTDYTCYTRHTLVIPLPYPYHTQGGAAALTLTPKPKPKPNLSLP